MCEAANCFCTKKSLEDSLLPKENLPYKVVLDYIQENKTLVKRAFRLNGVNKCNVKNLLLQIVAAEKLNLLPTLTDEKLKELVKKLV